MAEFLSPGVFIEEVQLAGQVVEAVGTSTMAIVGFTQQGVVEDPTVVTSAADYGRKFGGFTDSTESLVPHSVSAFFQNGGARAYVVRVVPADAVKASGDIATTVSAENVGTGDGTSTQNITVTLVQEPVVPGTVVVSWNNPDTPVAGENPIFSPAENGAILGPFVATLASAPISSANVVIDWTDGVGAKTAFIDNLGVVGGVNAANVTLGTINRTTGLLTLTFTVAPSVNTITVDYTIAAETTKTVTDDGAGAFSDAILGTTIVGTIDYVTGDLVMDWTVSAAGAPGSSIAIVSDYGHSQWGLESSNEGLFGNDLKLRLQGNTNFLTFGTQATANAGEYSKFDVTILQTDSVTGEDIIRETFEELVFDDALDAFYFPSVLNDSSDFVLVTDVGDLDIPASFKGIDRTAVVMGAGTGTLKVFPGTLANAPILKTSLEVNYTIGAAVITAVADVNGLITGASLDSTKTNSVNYTTGVFELNFVTAPDTATNVTADYISMPATTQFDYLFTGGSDGTLPLTGTVVTSPALEANKKGMFALNSVDEVMTLVIPDFAGDPTTNGQMLDYVESRSDMFAILTTPAGINAQQAADYKRITFPRRSKYAAMYWPHIVVADPFTDGRTITIPPIAHVAGIYARTDATRNVGKAPGGTVDGGLRGLIGLETSPGQSDRDLVAPARVNSLISSPQTGLAVWGVRTISPNNDIFRYVHAVRLFQFVQKSIFNSTQGFLFENISTSLYTAIKTTVDGFLMNLFNTGHFAGASPDQAFFVIVDSTNNPPEVINAGQVVVDVGIAPNRPGEFIRFRFSQKTLTAV